MKHVYLKAFLICCLIASFCLATELRTYRQFKDVATKETGQVNQSTQQGDLFEYTYAVDLSQQTITRTLVRRLDEASPHTDATKYTIMKRLNLLGSEAGNGGHVLVAVRKDGGELLELSRRFAFTMRLSPFSQVITGVYKRVHNNDTDHVRKNLSKCTK